MKQFLHRFIHHAVTELVIGVLILASIVLTAMEATMPEAHPAFGTVVLAGQIITLVFIVELLIRWSVARSTRTFLRLYWIDILAVIPVIRPLRVLRIFRLLRLVRLGVFLSRRTRKLAAILHEGVAENLIVFVIFVILLLIGSIGMPILEQGNKDLDSLDKSLWFSLYTLMAGEPVGGWPGTTPGKLLSAVLMMGGFTVFALLTGVVSAFMVTRLKGKLEAKDVELEELSNHFVICGWNRSVPVMMQELQIDPQTRDCAVVIVAELSDEPDIPPDVNADRIFFVRGDATSTEVLKKVRVGDARAAILVADNSKERSDQDRDARTILAALMIEKMHPGIYTSAQILHRQNETHLRMAGVEDVVVADEYVGNLIAHASRTQGLVPVINELMTSSRGNEFYRIPVPPALCGKTFVEASDYLKSNHDALLVSIETSGLGQGREVIVNPSAECVLEENDALIVIAREEPDLSADEH